MVLAASTKYGNDAGRLLASADLQNELKEVYQQFLGEMLLAALEPSLERDAKFVPGELITFERRILVVSGIGATLVVLLFTSSVCIAFVAYATSLVRRNLNLTQDPGTISAATSLILADRDVLDVFRQTDRLSQRHLNVRLGKRSFLMSHGSLLLLKDDEYTQHSGKAAPPHLLDDTKDSRPIVLRGWIAVLLICFLSAIVATIAALYVISCTTGIHQAPFVYQSRLNFWHQSTILAPYSILPTLLALGVKLWFKAVGDALKLLQPYVSMVQSPVPASKSVLADYINTPIGLATGKALKNHHWILAIVGLGALVTEILTVGMSALWDKEVGTSSHPVEVVRRLELRKTPQVFQVQNYVSYGVTMDVAQPSVLKSLYQSSVQSWLYGASVELSQSGLTPAWSKDTWSFLPLDREDVSNADRTVSRNTRSVPGHTRNITFQTSALTARLECHMLDYPLNTTAWLRTIEFKNTTIDYRTNQTMWNATNSPSDLERGYTLIGMARCGPRDGYYICCGNETNETPGLSAIGYWTNRKWIAEYNSYTDAQLSMTAKWIVGRPLEKLYQPGVGYDGHNPPLFIWSEPPKILMAECTPFIERANASVTAELDTGAVQSYEILGTPQNATEAWLDHYLAHNTSADHISEVSYDDYIADPYSNMTTSWGYVFWDTLLNSGRASEIGANLLTQYSYVPETLEDRSFNFRIKGLNADFMSYSMLALVNNSKEALLDPETFMDIANRTFGTFFKHFVSENVSSSLGGAAYQPIGEMLPWSLGAVLGDTTSGLASYQGALGVQNDTIPSPMSVNATIQLPIEQLAMSPVAVYLCLSLLIFLMGVTITMYVANRNLYKQLPRNVDTLASTLAFVHGSEKLQAWVKNLPPAKPWFKILFSRNSEDNVGQVKACIGPFTDTNGIGRWGIELVDERNHEHHEETGSSLELAELQPRHDCTEDQDGDLAVQTGLLGDFVGQDRDISAVHSNLPS